MRYGLDLLPNLLLLVALLRMTFVGLAAQRTSMFFFLCVWLVYSLVTLFMGQVWADSSRAFNVAFFLFSLPAWLSATPALWIASRRLSVGSSAIVLVIVAMAMAASRFAVMNSSLTLFAKLLAVNCWTAVVVGSVFSLASRGAEGADLYLWRCAGLFFLIFGFGYFTIALVPGPRAYLAFVLALTTVWFALAYFIGPRPEHIFNLEKLGVIWSIAKFLGIPIPVGRFRRS